MKTKTKIKQESFLKSFARASICALLAFVLTNSILFISRLYMIKSSYIWFDIPVGLIFYFLLYEKSFEVVR